MKATLLLFALFLSTSVYVCAEDRPASNSVLGTWEGESICTVANSPCRDEHVIYEIGPEKTEAKKSTGKLEVAAYKIVQGEKQYMGSLLCEYSAEKAELRCHYRSDDLWLFTVSGQEMKGTLVIKGNTLYRRVNVKRK